MPRRCCGSTATASCPLAVDGLSDDTLGRRFRAADHPRLAALLDGNGPVHFALDCGLPDPYDGLVDGAGPHLACTTAWAARCGWTNARGAC